MFLSSPLRGQSSRTTSGSETGPQLTWTRHRGPLTDIDPTVVLWFTRTLNLGLSLQRAAGTTQPDPKQWAALMHTITESFGTEGSEP